MINISCTDDKMVHIREWFIFLQNKNKDGKKLDPSLHPGALHG